MKPDIFPHILLMIISLVVTAYGQDQPIRVGKIEFFGYSGIDLEKVKEALPFHEGDEISKEKVEEIKKRSGEAVERIIGHPISDINLICCDTPGYLSVFIGLGGMSLSHNPRPNGNVRLPVKALDLYEQCMKLLSEAIQKGAPGEDHTNGYSLSEYQPLRVIQLETRAYALDQETQLREVLMGARDDKQRIAAAYLLGYARRSRSQIAALAYASSDSNETVRNDSTRALVVLANSNLKRATEIPAEGFIELMLSGTWTDVNKASSLLSVLTQARSADLLEKLRRKEVLERLIEIARWRTSHANAARSILGRLGGIDEERLGKFVAAGEVDTIINSLKGK
jgi:hypothetical protein